MKKVKSLLIVLVAAALIMGAGYAAWTDNTIVTGTVNTGTMDVNIQWASLTKPPLVGGDVTHDQNTITFNVSDLYPTKYDSGDDDTFARLHFQVINDGSVPVMLDSVEMIPSDPDNPIWDWLRTRIHIHAGTPTGVNGSGIADVIGLTGGPSVLSGDLINIASIFMADAENPSKPVLKNFVLQPGKVIRFGGDTEENSSIRIFLSENAPNETQDQDVQFTLKFNWKQFNM